MREAVSMEGWTLRMAQGEIDEDDSDTWDDLAAAGLIVISVESRPSPTRATPAGRAWLAENDGKGGK